jgi:hemolysin III
MPEGFHVMCAKIGTTAAAKPLLRGYSHAVAAVLAVLGTVQLLRLTAGDPPKQLTMLIYGASAVLLFTVSALYHVGPWSPRRRVRLRQLDRAAIFVLIAGSYTPAVFNLLTGWWRSGLLAAAWGLAALGVVAVAPALHLPHQLVATLYVTLGWIALVALPQVVALRGAAHLLLPIVAGALYTVGALVYACRWPPLWPRVFGYHELFHLVVVVASTLVFLFMLQDVVPFVRR